MKNLWQATRHQSPSTIADNQLQDQIEVDVAIVGAGFSGLSCALHLAQQGVKVAVLEAANIGEGASGRNVGLTNPGLWIMPKETESLLGAKAGQKLNQFLIDAPQYVEALINQHQLDCDYQNNGTLHLAHSKASIKYLVERQQQLRAYGASIDLLDRQAAYAKTKAEGYYGALLDNKAGTLHPLKYCQGLGKIAVQKGVQLYEQSAVLDIQRRGKKLQLKTKSGMVNADKVILATNAYETHLSYSQQLYTPLYYSQLASQPLSEEQRQLCLPDNNGCWDTGMVMRSFRTDSDGRLLVGTVGNIHSKDARGLKHWSKHVISKTFPEIGELEYQYAWAGRIAKSSNNIPQLAEIDKDIIQIMGYSGRGIAGATVAGKEIAEYLTNQIGSAELALPLNKAKTISFNQLRAAVYEIGSQLSHFSDHIIR